MDTTPAAPANHSLIAGLTFRVRSADRRVISAAGLILVALILLAVAIPVRSGETPWDGKLGLLELPPHARAQSVVDLDEVVPVIGSLDVPVVVLPPSDWDAAPAAGWSPATWASLNLAQFGRFLDATGAPQGLVDAVWAQVGDRPISSTVPIEGLSAPSGAQASAGMVTSPDGAIRLLRWSPGDDWDRLDLAESTPDRTDLEFQTAVVDLFEEVLADAAVPHRAWAMRMMDTPASPFAFVELFPAVPTDADGVDRDADGLVDLPGITADVMVLADGTVRVARMDAAIARWVHADRPSDLPAGWSADPNVTIGGPVEVPDGPIRFAVDGTSELPSSESLAGGVGETGLDTLVVVDHTATGRQDYAALPPTICRDIPVAAVDALIPGHHGPDQEPDNLTTPNVPYVDHCQWQSQAGVLMVGLLPIGPSGVLVPEVGGVFSEVDQVGDAVVGLIPQSTDTDFGFEVVWPGAEHRLDGFVRIVDGDPVEGLLGFLGEVVPALDPDRPNTGYGATIIDYTALSDG